MKKLYPLFIAVLGIAVGVFSVLLIQTISGKNHRLKSEYQDWRKINLVLQTITENYVDSVDYAKVSDAGISACLQALDPHSAFLPPAELEESETELSGQFDGIGIQFNVPNDTAIVIEVIPGGPSQKIGVQAGDRILKVDDKVIAGVKYPQDSMVRKMRGPAGTKVNLTVKRDKETIPFEITRGKIPIHSVDAAFNVKDTIGYIRLSSFSRTTAAEIFEACNQLLEKGAKKFVLDLRGNSGGFLDQAYSVANLFLPKGAMIVYMEGVRYKREDLRANGKGPFQDVPLTVLIDDGTASSAEILAGAIQDNARGTIVGRRSFGKGLVQEPFYFNDGSGIRLTVARFFTPSGRCIQKPYSDDYNYEVLKRYDAGEMVEADSMKVEKGGIIPDVFVPADTTKASNYYISCAKKASSMRFASYFFDCNKQQLSSVDSFDQLIQFLDGANLEQGFYAYVKAKDGISPGADFKDTDKTYLMTQVRALVSRYSTLGDNAYYRIFLDIDETFKKSIEQ